MSDVATWIYFFGGVITFGILCLVMHPPGMTVTRLFLALIWPIALPFAIAYLWYGWPDV